METLKEFRNILLGHRITVYTDHRNLTYKNFNTDRVMRWRLAIEEYGPELIYIKGETNVVVNVFSHLATIENNNDCGDIEFIADKFGYDEEDDLPKDLYPLKFKTIDKYQRKDQWLMDKVQNDDKYQTTPFHGGGNNVYLITKERKIVIPKILQKRVVEWYHTFLCHPGETRTEQTIRQHFTFKGMRDLVRNICSKCANCQKSKKHQKKYGHLPAKQAETNPWETLCVDLIGPYSVKRKRQKPLSLWCATMIDPATGWLEIKEIDKKSADEIINVVDQAWLTRYPWPQQVISDRGEEFMKEFTRSL